MDDKTLMACAARAAGLELDPDGYTPQGWRLRDGRFWRPRDDDGDAFRLRSAAALDILAGQGKVFVASARDSVGVFESYAAHAGDMNAATRLAILRQAAREGSDPPGR